MKLKDAVRIFSLGLFLFCSPYEVLAEEVVDKLPSATECSDGTRIEALEKSLEAHRELLNMMQGSNKDLGIGSNCKIENYCCSVYCCKSGDVGTGGTPKCLEQCCAAHCDRFV